IKHVDIELAVAVAGGDGRPLRVDGPLDADDLRIALRHVLDIGECDFARYLLLQGERGLRGNRRAGDLGVDFQLADAEQALQAPGHRVGNSCAEDSGCSALPKALLRRLWRADSKDRV